MLSLLNVPDAQSAGPSAAADWAMRIPGYVGVKFSAVTRGFCWLAVDCIGEPIRLHTGAFYLLTNGRPYCVGSDPALEVMDAYDVFTPASDRIARCGDVEDVFLFEGGLVFDEANASWGLLPRLQRLSMQLMLRFGGRATLFPERRPVACLRPSDGHLGACRLSDACVESIRWLMDCEAPHG